MFVASYLQVFKIYYLMVNKRRYHDEHANQSYSTSAWSVSDLLVTSVCTFLTFIPGLLVGYFMMGMPAASVGYVILVLFMVALTAESLMDLLCQLVMYVPTAILVGQGTLVVLCAFAGGAFIDWSRLGFWIWLSQCSLYTWSTRGIMIHVFRHLTYDCPPAFLDATSQTCQFNGLTYPLEQSGATVSGTTVLAVSKELYVTDEWYQFGILLLLMGLFRLATYALLRMPWSQLMGRVRSHAGSPSAVLRARAHEIAPGAPTQQHAQYKGASLSSNFSLDKAG